MLTGFWRAVDAALPVATRGAEPERRARTRLLAAFLMLSAVAGLGTALLHGLFGATPVRSVPVGTRSCAVGTTGWRDAPNGGRRGRSSMPC